MEIENFDRNAACTDVYLNFVYKNTLSEGWLNSSGIKKAQSVFNIIYVIAIVPAEMVPVKLAENSNIATNWNTF